MFAIQVPAGGPVVLPNPQLQAVQQPQQPGSPAMQEQQQKKMLAANQGQSMAELISIKDTSKALPRVLVESFDVKTSEVKTQPAPSAAVSAALQVSDSMASAFTFNSHLANLQAARAQAQMMAHSAQLAAASSMGAAAQTHDTMAAVNSAAGAGFQLPPAAAYPFNPMVAMQRSLSGVMPMSPMPEFSLGVGGQVTPVGVGVGVGAADLKAKKGQGLGHHHGRSLEGGEEDGQMAMKRPRLIWTKQLHERFVEAVNKMGVDQAVPKAIMQSMNVKGITRENVASHLQKYRAQLKKNKTAAAAAAAANGGNSAAATAAAASGKDAAPSTNTKGGTAEGNSGKKSGGGGDDEEKKKTEAK
mmetsp:Transcript_7886/g.19425  ORF Transcript_7886/g.19425 Transcript_7886/m.19425 type:complete len:358 (-) Transcript_7886:2089-3162(-)